MINKMFYSTLTQVCVTILAIMVAFYGVLAVNLGQQAETYREEIIQNLQNIDNSVKSFSYITEPPLTSWENWTIKSEQESNAYYILSKETWEKSPVEVLDTLATWVESNYTEAVKMDDEVRDWLESRNMTRFSAHYNMARFWLHRLISDIYREFPTPPAKYDRWYIESFIDSEFPACETDFLEWAERHNSYYSGISKIRKKIDSAIKGISEAHLDSAKSSQQTLEFLLKENRTDGWDWHIKTTTEIIRYEIAMSTYYKSIFESLGNIYYLVNSTVDNINRYKGFNKIAFSNIQIPIIGMILTGVVIPMIILGSSDHIKKYTKKCKWWRWYYLIVPSIILFILFTKWGIDIISLQIFELYFV